MYGLSGRDGIVPLGGRASVGRRRSLAQGDARDVTQAAAAEAARGGGGMPDQEGIFSVQTEDPLSERMTSSHI